MIGGRARAARAYLSDQRKSLVELASRLIPLRWHYLATWSGGATPKA